MFDELRTFLLEDATIAGIVEERVYPNILPQPATLPALTFAQVSGVRVRDLSGPTGRARPRVTVNSWASTYSAVRALADAVRRRLDGYAGPLTTVVIGSSALDNEFDIYEQDLKIHRVMQDYIISHTED